MRLIMMPFLIILTFFTNSLNSQEKLSKSEKSFAKLEMKKGTRNATLVNDYGKKWKMRMSFPQNNEGKNALIIALHWAGGGDTYEEFNDCLVLPALKYLNTIIVSPEGENQLWSTGNNEEKILFIISNAKKYWNVDSSKIAILGYSNGGNGSWYFAQKYPDLFSAAIPMASAYPINKKINIPLYVIHGKKDELFQVSETEKWINKTKAKGTDVTFVVDEKLSHFQACAYSDLLMKAGDWLQNIWKEK